MFNGACLLPRAQNKPTSNLQLCPPHDCDCDCVHSTSATHLMQQTNSSAQAAPTTLLVNAAPAAPNASDVPYGNVDLPPSNCEPATTGVRMPHAKAATGLDRLPLGDLHMTVTPVMVGNKEKPSKVLHDKATRMKLHLRKDSHGEANGSAKACVPCLWALRKPFERLPKLTPLSTSPLQHFVAASWQVGAAFWLILTSQGPYWVHGYRCTGPDSCLVYISEPVSGYQKHGC